MKDLYGLTEKQINILKNLSYIDDDTIIYNDGHSIITGEPLYVVGFNTSKEQEEAYNIIFN
ncbi:MAG: hypothetical protein IJZ79_02355 [Bacilli bacterium]|nr:hypothetical protein [Bacilli bacterium]